MTAKWEIVGPDDYIWTPAELAQIARAAQAFQAALPGKQDNVVQLSALGVIDGHTKIDWPQPGEAAT
jgi:hypothetical protein